MASKALGGFEFHRRFALELGYTDMGIADRFSLHGRIGPFWTGEDLSLTFALGAGYDPHPALQLRAEYQRYFEFGLFSNFDIHLFSAGLLWRF